jgi:hypothetical protein
MSVVIKAWTSSCATGLAEMSEAAAVQERDVMSAREQRASSTDSGWPLCPLLHFNFQKNVDEYVYTLKTNLLFRYCLTQLLQEKCFYLEGEVGKLGPRKQWFKLSKLKKKNLGGTVAHTYNPSYLGGGDWEDP